MSDQTMIGSLGARSTSTPTNRPKSANGIDSSAVSTPISNGVAFRSSAAVSGSARKVIWPPKCVIVSEVHNRTKSALRHNPFNIVLLSHGATARRALRETGRISFWLARPASKFPADDRPAGSVFAGAHANRAAQRQAGNDLRAAVHKGAKYTEVSRAAHQMRP